METTGKEENIFSTLTCRLPFPSFSTSRSFSPTYSISNDTCPLRLLLFSYRYFYFRTSNAMGGKHCIGIQGHDKNYPRSPNHWLPTSLNQKLRMPWFEAKVCICMCVCVCVFVCMCGLLSKRIIILQIRLVTCNSSTCQNAHPMSSIINSGLQEH